jgi:hypothetical protein
MVIKKKFFHALSHKTEDILSHLVLIELLSSGMSEVIANTPSRITSTKIGFPKSDIFQLEARAALLVNISPQSDGTDILRSGTTKLSTLKTH